MFPAKSRRGFVLPQRRRGRGEVLWFSYLLSAICCAKRAGFPRRREVAKRVCFTAEAQRTLRRGVESGKREVEAGISVKIRIKIKGG